MKTDRRTVIKGLVAAISIAMIPDSVSALVETNKYQGEVFKEYGNAVQTGPKLTKKQITEVVRKVLLPDARRKMGSGVVVDIRMKAPTDFGRNNAIAWYTNNLIMGKRVEVLSKPRLDRLGGFIYCGRIIT